MAMVVAYWHKDGLDIYRFVDKKPVRQASGGLEEIKPIRKIFDKKVLIIGRELLFHTRKRYPPAPIKKLTKAVEIEVKDIFPISKPAFHSRIPRRNVRPEVNALVLLADQESATNMRFALSD